MSLRGRRQTTVTGVARNVRWRESQSTPVLLFRVEQVDDVGNVTGYVPVEATSVEIENSVTDGDEIEVTGTVNEDGVVELTELANRTTGATFTPSSNRLLGWAMLGLFGGMLGALLGSFVDPFGVAPALGALAGCIAAISLGIAATRRERSPLVRSARADSERTDGENSTTPSETGHGDDESTDDRRTTGELRGSDDRAAR